MKKLYSLILFLAFIIAVGIIGYQMRIANFDIGEIYEITNQYEYTNVTTSVVRLPKAIDLSVPFTAQAPFAKWDELHNEACEEAAVVMVHYFLKGEELTLAKADEELIKLVNWQVANWGSHHHLAVEKVAELLKYYGYQNVEVSYDITVDDIKREVSRGVPVIVPTAGRELGNPYYKQPGPLYHMLVIRGFEQNMFITNDPGTRRGEDFRYKQDVLFEAIHDLPEAGQEQILTGRRAMIVVNP